MNGASHDTLCRVNKLTPHELISLVENSACFVFKLYTVIRAVLLATGNMSAAEIDHRAAHFVLVPPVVGQRHNFGHRTKSVNIVTEGRTALFCTTKDPWEK